MTLAKGVRTAEVDRLLQLTLNALGTGALYSVSFDPTDPAFESVPPATWQESVEAILLETDDALGVRRYRLTGQGWIEALHVAGVLPGETLDRELGRLSEYLKGRVKGRRQPYQLTVEEASRELALDADWIYNVVESNLLEVRFRKRGASWHERYTGRVIVVPVTFGMEPVDFEKNLRAQVEQLQVDLEHREHLLSEFTCSYCGAPVVGQGPVEYEHHIALYRQFECGHADEDGWTRRPCPSSPEFPSIEEYDFESRSTGDADGWAWSCSPRGTTASAKQLSLSSSYGRTPEEAVQKAREGYARYAKKWRA